MHDAGEGGGGVLLGQDAGHVGVGVAGVDDEGEGGGAGGLDVEAQALLLHGGARGGVVVVEAGLADADELRVPGEGGELVEPRHRLLGGVHRVGAGGPEDLGVGLGDGLHLRRLAEAGADRHHAGDAGGAGAGDDGRDLAREVGEVEVAMAVDEGAASAGGPEGQAARARASAAAASIRSKVSRITWAGSRLTARAWAVRSARRGDELGPEPGLGGGGGEAGGHRGLGLGEGGDRGAGAGEGEAAEGGGDELERELVARRTGGRRRPRRGRWRGGGRAGLRARRSVISA